MALARKRRAAMTLFQQRPQVPSLLPDCKLADPAAQPGTFCSAGQLLLWFVPPAISLTLSAPRADGVAGLQADARTMDAVAEQLFLELSDLRAQRTQHRQLRTLQGRYFNVVGHFLSVYGLYRVVMAAVNTALRRVGKIDPGTRCVQIAVDWLGLPLDAQVWTQHVSFILVGTAWPLDPVPLTIAGVMIVSSIRSFLIQLTKVCCAVLCRHDAQ